MAHENILILGVTGSIGKNAVKIIQKWPERFTLIGFSYHSNFTEAQKIQKQFSVKYITCSKAQTTKLQQKYWKSIGVEFFSNLEEILEVNYNKVLISVVGSSGVKATYKASKQGKIILIANKESLVMAGTFIMQSALENKTKIIPIDSEHNSLYRLIKNINKKLIQKMYITASGGPLYHLNKEQIQNIKKKEVLNHPNWDMGAKISVDSASMANKALEIIEACHLFQLNLNEISAVIHPQSYIHAIIQYKDGSYFLHASEPDMLYPLSHGFFYPEEPTNWIPYKHHIFPNLTFSDINYDQYPIFNLGIESAKKGGAYPTIFNAANEEAVSAFLEDKIKFHEIFNYIDQALDKSNNLTKITVLDDLFKIDLQTRDFIRKKI